MPLLARAPSGCFAHPRETRANPRKRGCWRRLRAAFGLPFAQMGGSGLRARFGAAIPAAPGRDGPEEDPLEKGTIMPIEHFVIDFDPVKRNALVKKTYEDAYMSFVVAYGYDEQAREWGQGSYHMDFASAAREYLKASGECDEAAKELRHVAEGLSAINEQLSVIAETIKWQR